jgi:hypothetical protein
MKTMCLEGAPEMEGKTREQKEQRWQEMAARVDKLTDRLGNPVDEGIKETVIILNLLGFPTTMSCEGHAERAVGGPWVDMRPEGLEALRAQWDQAERACQTAREEKRPQEEMDRLYQALREARKEMETPVFQLAGRLMAYLIEFYQERMVPHDRRLILHNFLAAFRLQSHGVFLQEIADVAQREAKLLEYQEEMRAFTTFLKAHYFTD